jgi:hypothetical protein
VASGQRQCCPWTFLLGHRKLPRRFPRGEYQAAQVHLVRVYVADERVFVNAGSEVDLGVMQEQAKAVAVRIDLAKVGVAGSNPVVRS